MSIRLMTAAWALPVSSTDKLVLLALADWSNDDGLCWPSLKQLCDKSGLSERAVRISIGRLRDGGHLTRDEVIGKGVNYIVHPGTTCPPAANAPRHEMPRTPAPRAPNTPVTTSSKKASPSPKRRAGKPPTFVLPSDIPANEWADFEEMRKAIRKPMTDAIREKAITRLRKLAEDGHPPGAVLNHSTLNNYQGLFPPKDDHNGHRTGRLPARQSDLRGPRPDPSLDMLRASRAAQEAADPSSDWGDHLEAGLALPYVGGRS